VVHRIQYTYWHTKNMAPAGELPKAAPAIEPQPAREAVLAREKAQLPG
jgi:hypothetical protein